jgi:cytoplasmic iron level regulating protein YaaA (DUF328/UPF0246 family)
MLSVLSPAKNLDWTPASAVYGHSAPVFAKEASTLAAAARKWTRADVMKLMNLSEKLADLNVARYAAFSTKPAADACKQAMLAFNGDVYQGLKAKTLSPDALDWAQDRVGILSGLYGLLRPLDLIQPYRLEMGTKFAGAWGEDLYDFWGAKLAKVMDAKSDGTVINLASDEYFSAVDRKALKSRVITPCFLDVKDAKARPVFLFVKQARGMMARFIIENRIDSAEALKDFNGGKYKFDAKRSDEFNFVFTRKQPPPIAETRAKEVAKKGGAKKARA